MSVHEPADTAPTSRFARLKRLDRHFGHHVRPHWRGLLAAWFCMLGVTTVELLRPWPIKVVFDFILMPERGARRTRGLIPASWIPADRGDILIAVIVAVVAIALVGGVFAYGEAFLLSSIGQKVAAGIRRQLYGHIQRLSRSFHDTTRSGDLLVRLTGDITLLRELLVSSLLLVSERVLIVVAMLAVMLWIDLQLTLVALAVLPLLGVSIALVSRKIRKAMKRQRRKEGKTATLMSQTIASISVVQAFAREAYEEERFSKQHEADLQAGLRAARFESNLVRSVEVIVAFGTAAVIWLGVTRVLDGQLTPGDLLVFTAYLTSAYKPMRKLATLTSRMARAAVCAERIMGILDRQPDVKEAPDAIRAGRVSGAVAFENVTFEYPTNGAGLDGISFALRPGETVALVGESGAGKSTVTKLLLRFYDPDGGRILIDGVDIRQYTLSSLREQFAVVLQDSTIFGATIQENIAYGNLNASFDEIIAAAKAAHAHDFIMELEQGYDAVIGEHGVGLSGGQRQRIAIARALIRNAPILILDEPMSGLDAESEARIGDALAKLMRGRTCLLISHDLAAAARADRIIFLRDGRIVDEGRHDDLVARNAAYRRLVDAQVGTRLSGAA